MASVEGLMHGLYLLWWVEEKQMPPALVAAVLATGDLALMGLELPTGWFADRFGHRASLIVGSFVQVLGMLWCWLGQGVYGLVTASVLAALGDGFRSGADQALLYRTCLALDCEDQFQKIEGRTRAVETGLLVGLTLLGGAIVHVGGFALGWLAEATLCSVGLVIAWAMVEPPAALNHATDRGSTLSTPVRYRRLAILIMPAALLGGAAAAASFLAQTTGTYGIATVTLLVAALTAAEAGGCALGSQLPAATARHQVLLALLGFVLVFAVVALPATVALAALALAFLLGVALPLRSAAIQRVAEDGARARAASAAGACDMAISTIVLPLAGLWGGRRRL